MKVKIDIENILHHYWESLPKPKPSLISWWYKSKDGLCLRERLDLLYEKHLVSQEREAVNVGN